jgi:hypothetical protein
VDTKKIVKICSPSIASESTRGPAPHRFGPNPSSPKAKEELIVVVACQECTQITGFALKANKTKEESVVADVPFTPGPSFPMHLLLRGKWK